MQCFPIDWNLRTARLLARAWAVVMPRHRQRAVAHLAASLGDVHPIRRISTMADRCLESVAMFAVEAVCLPRLITPMSWSRYIRLVDFDETLQVLLAGRGVILVTGHYGSFEIVGHLLAAPGFDVAAVMRPLDNVYLNRFIVSSRRTHGLRLLDKRGASAEAEGMLREGTLVGFIGDQDAGRKGIFVEFFGRPASTYKSIGLLAMATGSPIVVGYARRRGGAAHYDVGVQRVIHPRGGNPGTILCDGSRRPTPARSSRSFVPSRSNTSGCTGGGRASRGVRRCCAAVGRNLRDHRRMGARCVRSLRFCGCDGANSAEARG